MMTKKRHEFQVIEDHLAELDKFTIGDAKKTRIAAYIRLACRLSLEDQIDIPALMKLSRNNVVKAKHRLGEDDDNDRCSILQSENGITDETRIRSDTCD